MESIAETFDDPQVATSISEGDKKKHSVPSILLYAATETQPHDHR